MEFKLKDKKKEDVVVDEKGEEKKVMFSFKAVKDFLDDFFEKQLSNLKDMFSSKKEDETKEKYKTLADELDRISPIIEQAGYIIRETRMSIGLPPFVEIYLYNSKPDNDTTFAELAEQYKGDKAVSMILNALESATKLQTKSKIGKQMFQEIILTLSVPPRISARYIHEDYDLKADL